MNLRTVIVDDEPEARSRLRSLLRNQADIEIVAECRDGQEAIELIRKHNPDLVFLDIQMPEKNGFEVLTELGEGFSPAVIFVTAYDHFAVEAFEVHAVDYLLKPFDVGRLVSALEKARQRLLAGSGGGLSRELLNLLSEVRSGATARNRIPVKVDGRIILIGFEEIDWIEAENNYAKLHVGDRSYLVRETMSGLEARLPESQFTRVSRFAIVNLDKVRELQPMFHGDYAVVLRSGVRVTLTRSYRDRLELLMA